MSLTPPTVVRARSPEEAAPVGTQRYWDDAVDEALAGGRLDAWREYMQRVYTRLVNAWVMGAPELRGLKTDLFEEAVSRFNLLSHFASGSVGIDTSPRVARAAAARVGPGHHVVVCDVRRIPLEANSVDFVLSGSSLDHFREISDIDASLRELERLLREGGTLVLTLDNPQNPIVWMRNRIPFRILYRLGLIPYFVGATLSREEARRRLAALGFDVTATTAVVHAPRLPSIWIVAASERLGLTGLRAILVAALDRFELLERLPTRYITGYYVAVRAEKRNARGAGPGGRRSDA